MAKLTFKGSLVAMLDAYGINFTKVKDAPESVADAVILTFASGEEMNKAIDFVNEMRRVFLARIDWSHSDGLRICVWIVPERHGLTGHSSLQWPAPWGADMRLLLPRGPRAVLDTLVALGVAAETVELVHWDNSVIEFDLTFSTRTEREEASLIVTKFCRAWNLTHAEAASRELTSRFSFFIENCG